MHSYQRLKMRDYMFLDKPVFTLDEAKTEFNSEGALFGALKRAMDRGEIRRLAPGLYCSVNTYTGEPVVDKFEIGTALRPDGYCAYNTALEYYGFARNRAYDEVQMIAGRQTGPVVIDGVSYKTFVCSYSEGVIETRWKAPIRVTDTERTIVDCLDRMELCGGLQEVFSALSRVRYADEDKLAKYLDGYGLKFLYKKAGYLLSVLSPSFISKDFIELCREKSSSRADDIRPTKGIPFIFSKEWNLYVPAYIAKKRVYTRPSKAAPAGPEEPPAVNDEVPADAQEPGPAEGEAMPPAETDSAQETGEDTG